MDLLHQGCTFWRERESNLVFYAQSVNHYGYIRERERERENVCVCVCERERERECVCVCVCV